MITFYAFLYNTVLSNYLAYLVDNYFKIAIYKILAVTLAVVLNKTLPSVKFDLAESIITLVLLAPPICTPTIDIISLFKFK